MPCIWLGIPAAVLAVVDQRYWRWNFVYGGFVLLVLFILLAPAKIRNQLPEWLGNEPGGLGQITIWKPLVKHLEKIEYKSINCDNSDPSKTCQNENAENCNVNQSIVAAACAPVAGRTYPKEERACFMSNFIRFC